MANRRLGEIIRQFAGNDDGDTPIRTTLWIGAVALGVAVLSAPLLDNASKTYAENRAFGIDRVLTGSIKNSKRYTVRRSVLQQGETRICGIGDTENC